MTSHTSSGQPAVAPLEPAVAWRPRGYVELLTQQLAGIAQFNLALRLAQQAESAVGPGREAGMDFARYLRVLDREHQAVVDRTSQQLQLTGQPLHETAPATVLLAHRSLWFLDRISATLLNRGLNIVGRLDNGADTIGHATAEQPDLLLVEDLLAMVPGDQVLRDVRRFSPHTRVIVHADHPERVGPLLQAGASAVYTRRVTPVDVATGMCRLLTA